MSVMQTRRDTTGQAVPAAAPAPRTRGVAPVLAMLVATLVGSILPSLRTPGFYFWDDTAGVAAGVWQRIAESVLAGESPFLHLDLWQGGNFAAEAATGMWNPVMLGLMLGTYPIDDVAIAMTVAKLALFLITAGGVYVLSRGFGANPWMAAVAGTTLSLSGWVIYMDGSSWINGTAITALTPWAWWALRRAYLRGFRPGGIVLAVAVGALVPSTGNPYGVLTLAAVFLAVAVEAVMSHRARAIGWLVAIGLSTVLLVVVVYLPFVLTSSYGVRANSEIANDEFLAISLSHLLGMSSPTHRPYITMFGGQPMGFPGTYLGWFVLPLLPWLRWSDARGDWRRLSGLLTFGAFFLIFALGPSQLGMFRWPARLVPFLYLAVIVLFAVLASRGLRTDRRTTRGILSAAIILFGAWMAYSDVPGAWKWHALVTALIGLGVFVTVRWTGTRSARSFAVLAGGMVLFMGAQLALSASNQNVADYRMPTSKEALAEEFGDRSDGLVVQIFDIQRLVSEEPEDERWRDLLAGNMPSVAGIESTTSYTGIGFNRFGNALCLSYNGGTCSAAWPALWEKLPGADAVLADLLRAEYVVVQNDFVDDRDAPEGWNRAERTDVVTVFERAEPLPFPDGTVSAWGTDVTVESATRSGAVDERVTVSTGGGDDRLLTFARIAWPGYSITLDGEPLTPEVGPAGLLQVELPADVRDAELEISFTPPGLTAGLISAGVGLVLLAATLWLASRRRPQDDDAATTNPPAVHATTT